MSDQQSWNALQSVQVPEPQVLTWQQRLANGWRAIQRAMAQRLFWYGAGLGVGLGLLVAFVVVLAFLGFPGKAQAQSKALITPSPMATASPTPRPTPTPTATATSQPTPTPVTLKVKGAEAETFNIRAEPSLQAPVVTTVPGGATLIWTGRTQQGQYYRWYEVIVEDEHRGWIADILLEDAPSP